LHGKYYDIRGGKGAAVAGYVPEGAPGIQDLPEPDLDRTGPLSIFAALLSNLVSNVPAVLVFKFGEYARAGVPLTVLSLAAGVWMLN
jgi:hypothetical protein